MMMRAYQADLIDSMFAIGGISLMTVAVGWAEETVWLAEFIRRPVVESRKQKVFGRNERK